MYDGGVGNGERLAGTPDRTIGAGVSGGLLHAGTQGLTYADSLRTRAPLHASQYVLFLIHNAFYLIFMC